MRRLTLCLCFVGCDGDLQLLTTADAAHDGVVADSARVDAAVDAVQDSVPADAARDAAPVVDAAAVVDAAPVVDAAAVVDAAPPGPHHGLDDFPYRCADPAWRPAACAPGVGEFHESIGAQHVADDVDIPPYALTPPSSGPHRGRWGRWGEYISLPPERWLHNLEHGGIAVLYHPCAPAETIAALRALVRARPEGEALRWVMTPYADLPTAVALVAWEWRYQAHCIQAEEVNLFIDRYHAQGPEDVAGDGGYAEGWVGR